MWSTTNFAAPTASMRNPRCAFCSTPRPQAGDRATVPGHPDRDLHGQRPGQPFEGVPVGDGQSRRAGSHPSATRGSRTTCGGMSEGQGRTAVPYHQGVTRRFVQNRMLARFATLLHGSAGWSRRGGGVGGCLRFPEIGRPPCRSKPTTLAGTTFRDNGTG
jgi:hypothetical protein